MYFQSQAAMDDFWNAIVVQGNQDDSSSEDEGAMEEGKDGESDVVKRERPRSFLSVDSQGRSSIRNVSSLKPLWKSWPKNVPGRKKYSRILATLGMPYDFIPIGN